MTPTLTPAQVEALVALVERWQAQMREDYPPGFSLMPASADLLAWSRPGCRRRLPPRARFHRPTTEAAAMKCRNRSRTGECCCAPKCRVCGYGKHASVHLPAFGEPDTAPPWGHEFQRPVEPSAAPEKET